MDGWHVLGPIVGLQIQRSSLKIGPRGAAYYDPAPLLPVERLFLTPDGAMADADGARLDVHNVRHADSKNVRGTNDVSVGFTSGYATMRARFGARVGDGIAGENILVACEQPLTLNDLSDGLLIVGPDGRQLELTHVLVAHPCVEFSRWALDDPSAPTALVSKTLKFLDGGVRGFYASLETDGVTHVELGDQLLGRIMK